MRLTSEFHCVCACGSEQRHSGITASAVVACTACGRTLVLDWRAEYVSEPSVPSITDSLEVGA